MSLPVCNSLWIGERLGRVERACLRSALRHGHRMRLYCYDAVEGIPEGVEVADANDILHADKIIRYDTGSVALFANHFRYALQARKAGLWVDTDSYFLKPHDFNEPYVFGRQRNGNVANGILLLPPESPVLAALLALFDAGAVPVWGGTSSQDLAREALARGDVVPWGKMKWGLTGPRALTHYLKENGLYDLAKPSRIFYPTDFTEADWIVDPKRSLDEFIAPDTVALHLWNEKIKAYKNEPAPRGSFLARLQTEGA